MHTFSRPHKSCKPSFVGNRPFKRSLFIFNFAFEDSGIYCWYLCDTAGSEKAKDMLERQEDSSQLLYLNLILDETDNPILQRVNQFLPHSPVINGASGISMDYGYVRYPSNGDTMSETRISRVSYRYRVVHSTKIKRGVGNTQC